MFESGDGIGIFGTEKWSETLKPVSLSPAWALTRLELRPSSAYGTWNAPSSIVEAAGMSFRRSAFASTRIAWSFGLGWLAIGAEARRLSEKLDSTARSVGVP